MKKTNDRETISVKIEVELDTLEQIEKIFSCVDNKNAISLCDGEAEIKLITAGNTMSFDGGATATLLLSFSVGVASGVVGNIIYALLCKGIKKLELNGRRTRITEENITEVLETIKNVSISSENKKCIVENTKETK